ncbi:MAG: ATP-binding protein [Betaproteobacteria bacterium AqS2]|uniref:ATP-binding protein n=1 Tax=Candidatus Amphirhobacter heronislandensis TaxID=1732024 RepID=A0A930UD66_9GAMM|nr:ATP-binding protein [Betaproteobacteria bacterium AqS2]
MIAKRKASPRNPFKAGAGSRPLLAGREKETETLTEMLSLLCGKREKWRGPLASESLPPIRIIGPHGAGKTALLDWTRRQAEEWGIHCVSCTSLKAEGIEFFLQKLVANALGGPIKLLHLYAVLVVKASERLGSGKRRLAEPSYMDWMGVGLRRRPLLLLLDDAQDYDLRLLSNVLCSSHVLIGRGWPLGLVMTTTPGLDDHLLKDKYLADYLFYRRRLLIGPLSEAATRTALQKPFEQEGVTVAPDALAAMAAQTDSYPHFIQLVGRKVWEAMEEAGRKDVDVELVRRIEGQVQEGKRFIYAQAYERLDDNGLIPYACQVMELLERKGGKAHEDAVTDALIAANDEVDEDRAEEIYAILQEDGFIWTDDDETTPCIPSLFSYCRDKQQENKAS